MLKLMIANLLLNAMTSPVGASGSKIVIAKLFVALGAADLER
jgi:hypothetical protein